MYYYLIFIIILLLIYIYWPEHEIYFDNNATTIPHAAVIKSINASYDLGNPSAYYSFKAQSILVEFKKYILNILGKPNHVCIITSGASESNNLLVNGLKHLYTIYCSNFEHKNILESNVTQIPYNLISNAPIGNLLANNSILSVMAVNNETGNILPIDNIAHALKSKYPNLIIHSDMAQYFGKLNPDLLNLKDIDCFSISFHKMHGPYGIGVLVLPEFLATQLNPQIYGTQNSGLRGGTENLPAIVGAFKSMEITLHNRVQKNQHLYSLKQYFMSMLKKYRTEISQDYFNGSNEYQSYITTCKLKKNAIMFINIPNTYASINTVLVSFINNQYGKRFCNIQFRKLLTQYNIKVSIGSACNTSRKGASHVLHNLKLPFIVRCGVIRFSFGDYNTFSDINAFESRIKHLLI